MRLQIALTPNEFDQLAALSRVERRHPRDQAALLVAHGLGLHEDGNTSRHRELETAAESATSRRDVTAA